MTEYLVGTGGWAFFQLPGKLPLKAYSEVLNFVEVNCTFYEYPSIDTVKRWRQIVPPDFIFSVRCHRDLTHDFGLRPVDRAFEVFNKAKAYCNILGTPYLVLETPASYILQSENIKAAQDFLASISTNGLQLVWEYRATLTPEVSRLMMDFGIIHSLDLSVQKPYSRSNVVYSRLFGKGKHNVYQFTDDELSEIKHNAEITQPQIVLLSFHGQRMIADALRFKRHQITGKYPPVTDFFGVDSAKAVLVEDAKFPVNKSELITDQGWKVIDLTRDKRVHLADILEKIPEKTYNGLDELLKELRMII